MNKIYTISNGQLKVIEDIVTQKETVFEVVAIQKRLDEIDEQIKNLQLEKSDLAPLIKAIQDNKVDDITLPESINKVDKIKK